MLTGNKDAILGYYVFYKLDAQSAPLVKRTVNGKYITSYLVTSLKKFTSYRFFMQAFNSRGASAQSPALVTKTKEDGKVYLTFHTFLITD